MTMDHCIEEVEREGERATKEFSLWSFMTAKDGLYHWSEGLQSSFYLTHYPLKGYFYGGFWSENMVFTELREILLKNVVKQVTGRARQNDWGRAEGQTSRNRILRISLSIVLGNFKDAWWPSVLQGVPYVQPLMAWSSRTLATMPYPIAVHHGPNPVAVTGPSEAKRSQPGKIWGLGTLSKGSMFDKRSKFGQQTLYQLI